MVATGIIAVTSTSPMMHNGVPLSVDGALGIRACTQTWIERQFTPGSLCAAWVTSLVRST
jgi:hypothetical protein